MAEIGAGLAIGMGGATAWAPTDVASLVAWYREVSANGFVDQADATPISATLAKSHCGTFDGSNDKLVFLNGLASGTTIVSYVGTANPSINTGAGEITATSGTLCKLLLSDGTFLPLSEGQGAAAYDTSGNGNHAEITNASTATAGSGFWANRQNSYHHNINAGYSIGNNRISRSEAFNHANWTSLKNACSVTANTGSAPSGGPVADSLIEDSATTSHFLRQNHSGISELTTYTFSCYAKSGTRDYVMLALSTNNSGSGLKFGHFNLATGVASDVNAGSGNYGMEAVGNGWYRCWVRAIMNAGRSTADTRIYLYDSATYTGSPNYSGNGSGSISLWGAQFEAGSAPSTYTPSLVEPNLGLIIPGGATGALNTITRPAGDWHNGCETVFHFPNDTALKAVDNSFSTRFFYTSSAGQPKDVGYAQLVANVENKDKIFANVATEYQKKDLMVFSSALTGTTKTQVKAYLGQG